MHVSVRVFAALLAVSSLLPAAVVRADDEEKPAAKSDKTAEKAPPTEVTTPGSVNGITYSAVVGTLTVGATDAQDAQLGADGKPLAWKPARELRGQGSEGCIADGENVVRGLLQEGR